LKGNGTNILRRLIDIRTLHLLSLLSILAILIVGAVAFVEKDVAYISVFNMENIEIGKCFYKSNFGLECPSCGLTRSFISIENFDFMEAIRYNRVGIFVYLLMIFLMIFNIMGLFKAKVTLKYGKFVAAYGFVVCILLIISWSIKMFFLT